MMDLTEMLIFNAFDDRHHHDDVCGWSAFQSRMRASLIFFWGIGFVLIAWSTFAVTPGGNRATLILAMTTIWGVRLAAYLAWRNHGKGEDPRYRAMRDSRGSSFGWVSLITVFGLQGVVMWVISLPIQVGQLDEAPLATLNYLGIIVWMVGFLFESVGDYQLARFKAKTASKRRSARSRPLAIHATSELLWQFPSSGGAFFLVSTSTATLWLAISPALMDFLAAEGLRSCSAGKESFESFG